MATRSVRLDPNVKITDLVHRLVDDSKRLVRDEVRLAKLETRENAHVAGKGVLRLGFALGIGVIALVAFTVLLVTLLGRLTTHLWAGALITGAAEILVGAWLIRRGSRTLARTDYTLDETRDALRTTTAALSRTRAT